MECYNKFAKKTFPGCEEPIYDRDTTFQPKQQQRTFRPLNDSSSESSESESDYEQEQNYGEQERYTKKQPLGYQQGPKAFYKKKQTTPFNVEQEQEEELFTKKQPFNYEQEEQQEQKPRKWVIVIDTEEFRPEDIDTEVDPIYHTLTISAKRLRQPKAMEQEQLFYAFKRVIPLPKNVNADKLRMKYTPRGELLVKAPYNKPTICDEEDEEEMEQQQRRYFAVPTYFNQQQQKQQRGGKYTIPVIFSKRSQPRREQQQQQLFYTPEFFPQTKKNTTTMMPKNFRDVEYVRDETTGQWKVLINVNVVGFRREEVRVNFEEEEHLLLIEARHQLHREEFEQLKGIAPKTLRREFILPEWLEATQMRYRVLKNGLLRIEVPCLVNPKKFQKQQQQQLFKNFYYQF